MDVGKYIIVMPNGEVLESIGLKTTGNHYVDKYIGIIENNKLFVGEKKFTLNSEGEIVLNIKKKFIMNWKKWMITVLSLHIWQYVLYLLLIS